MANGRISLAASSMAGLLLEDSFSDKAPQMRIMLDSNVHDLVAADQTVIEAIEQRISDGRLMLISSHVQRDELSRTPEPKRTALLAIYGMTETVPTTGAAWGVSNWDESTWGDEAVNTSIVAHMAGNPKHAKDALIGKHPA